MSKRKSVLGSEGGTCYKDGPLPQVQCLVLKGGGGHFRMWVRVCQGKALSVVVGGGVGVSQGFWRMFCTVNTDLK